MTLNASYYVTARRAERDNCNWVPEASRRARGFAVYAALRFWAAKESPNSSIVVARVHANGRPVVNRLWCNDFE